MKRILDMRAFVFCVVLAFAVITLPGCSSEFSKNSYTTLATLGATYDGVMKSAAEAHKIGAIDDVAVQKILDAGGVFYGTYQTAVAALEIYVKAEKTGDTSMKGYVTQTITTAVLELNRLIDNYNAIASGVAGMRKWDKLKGVE